MRRAWTGFLRSSGLAGLVVLAAGLAAPPAAAQQLPTFSDAILAEWQQRYPRGIYSNYREVILPRLSAADRRRLQGMVFEFPLRLEDAEPFGFAADAQNQIIYMSVQSLKFFDEATIAAAWLNRNGYTLQSLTNYWLMLRNWKTGDAPPPLLKALCIPDDAIADPDVDSLSQKIFSTAIFFVMLHEIGHVLGGHDGYGNVTPAVARQREAAADAFALDVMARVGDAPFGVVNLFLAMTYFSSSRSDFGSDAAYQEYLARRTHPLSPERLRAFASTVEQTASSYTGGGLSRVQIAAMGGQIRLIAQTLQDIDILNQITGQAISPADLGPMKPGEIVGRSCTDDYAGGQPFAGNFTGITTINNVEFDLEAQLRRDGNQVTGRSSYGAGFSTIQGVVEAGTLHYRWRLGQATGTGVLNHANGIYDGTWANDDPGQGSGIIQLQRE